MGAGGYVKALGHTNARGRRPPFRPTALMAMVSTLVACGCGRGGGLDALLRVACVGMVADVVEALVQWFDGG